LREWFIRNKINFEIWICKTLRFCSMSSS
jgi:hypothetical protein